MGANPLCLSALLHIRQLKSFRQRNYYYRYVNNRSSRKTLELRHITSNTSLHLIKLKGLGTNSRT
jgi:hypothetical protein